MRGHSEFWDIFDGWVGQCAVVCMNGSLVAKLLYEFKVLSENYEASDITDQIDLILTESFL